MSRKFLTGLRLANLSEDPVSGVEGELYFNTTSFQVRMYADGDWKYASESSEEVQLQVKNITGSTINKGTPVYITGTTGADTILTIGLANASSASTMPAVGLITSNLNNDEEGFAVISGFLRGLNTATIDGQTPVANQTVYVKSGGGLTLTKPTGTNLIQNIAKVGRVDSNTGSLIVSSIMRTNDIPNIASGHFWLGNASAVPVASNFTTEVNRSASATYLTIASASATYATTSAAFEYASSASANANVLSQARDNLKADLASPSFTGTPTAPTAAAGTNTTQIATTAYSFAAASSASANASVRVQTDNVERLFLALC